MWRHFKLVTPFQTIKILLICFSRGARLFVIWVKWCRRFHRTILDTVEGKEG